MYGSVPRRRAFRLVWESCARRMSVVCSMGEEVSWGMWEARAESDEVGREARAERI